MWLAAWLAAALGCAPSAAPHGTADNAGIARYGRPRGMPIGTGAGGTRAAADADDPDNRPPPEVTGAALPIPKFDAAAEPPSAPCAGCVELSLYASDINQRDEFAFDAGGLSVRRVVWTLIVNFNSDQLAVQPFVNDRKGTYTELDANTFPLGKPVELAQEFKGKAHAVGLVLASAGAWTGDQRVSVFVDAVRAEGSPGFSKSFDADAEGFAPRTHQREPRIVAHALPRSPGEPLDRNAGGLP